MRNDENYARAMDAVDPLARFRDQFLIPKGPDGKDCAYFTGNSLGLQPKKTRKHVEEVLDDWARLGVEGHFKGERPWMPYHERLTQATARVVGAKPIEVVVMNTLTVNLHLMMASFYAPTKERFKILVEKTAFPSDQYAVASQARLHGYDPKMAILEVEHDEDRILETIDREGSSIALVMLGSVNYLSGYAFDLARITRAAHARGCRVGFDLAHGAGNLALGLHDAGPDFAVWCGYKYLNGGPGTLSGCFVHERHAYDRSLNRLAGWWGQNKAKRFEMGPVFDPIPGAEGWQLSNAPILQLASLRAPMELFDEATMPALVAKREKLTGYLEFLLDELPQGLCEIVTPRDPKKRGAQLSLKVHRGAKDLVQKLIQGGVICDFREPNIVRAAPVPFYNTFHDIYRFVRILKGDAA